MNVGLKVAKVRFSQVLQYSLYCITLAKERKEGNPGVTFLLYQEVMIRV